MLSAILGIVTIAVLGSLSVPIIMLTLARLGHFEPIQLAAFGRPWNFAPKSEAGHAAFIEATVSTFPLQRQTVFASVVTVAYSVAAPAGVAQGVQYHLETGAAVVGQIRDARKVA